MSMNGDASTSAQAAPQVMSPISDLVSILFRMQSITQIPE